MHHQFKYKKNNTRYKPALTEYEIVIDHVTFEIRVKYEVLSKGKINRSLPMSLEISFNSTLIN